jgi:hypothetical protein
LPAQPAHRHAAELLPGWNAFESLEAVCGGRTRQGDPIEDGDAKMHGRARGDAAQLLLSAAQADGWRKMQVRSQTDSAASGAEAG